MSTTQAAPYGTWESPLSADTFAAGALSLAEVVVNQSTGKIYLLEARPAEGGRGCILEIDPEGSSHREVLPKEYNPRTHVHGLGGASFTSHGSDGRTVFSDDGSNIVYQLDPATLDVQPIVLEDSKNCFADFCIHPNDTKWILAIREDRHAETNGEVENTLVVIDVTTKIVHTIVSGADFYAYPRFSHDGEHLCWTQWDHPNMPWNYTQLWVADWQDGTVLNARTVAGQDIKESISQPQWGPDGTLFFVGDQSGFWQLYRFIGDKSHHIHLVGLEKAEFGGPDRWLGSSTYCPLTSEKLVAFYNLDGFQDSIVIDVTTEDYEHTHLPINQVSFNGVKRTSPTSFVVIGSTATTPQALYHISLPQLPQVKSLRSSLHLSFPTAFFSPPRHIGYLRTRSPEGGHAQGLLFSPKNPNYVGPPDSLPPLIVVMHGGPTWQTGPGLSLSDQYWTTRGYALVQINYVGSTGYGREYTRLLQGQWGVADIADAASAVDHLASQGLIDRKRVGITGLSAGGYATIQALAVYGDVFAAGVTESGISDLQAILDQTTQLKFRSHYVQQLCFPADASEEERERIVRDRSPIHQAHRIKAPLLALTGSVDPVVPVSQTTGLADAVRRCGGVVEVVVYEGEGHGLKLERNVRDCVERTEGWWRRFLLGERKEE